MTTQILRGPPDSAGPTTHTALRAAGDLRPLPPFYYGVVVWGAEYREYFTRYCLSSLLAPGNIPALENGADSRFLICTTTADWAALQDDPAFGALKAYVEPIFVEMPASVIADKSTMLAMSWGHKEITTRCFEARACGVIVCPDIILSDGSLAALARHVRRGRKSVVTVGLRFSSETLLPELAAHGLIQPGHPLTLSGRELAAIASRHLHSETTSYIWDLPYFRETPVACIWRMPGDAGLLVHSLSWGALLIDYGRLAGHDTSCFEHWTMDGDYVYANVGDGDDVHVVTDSDELLMISFTRESAASVPLYRRWTAKFPPLERYRKKYWLRRFMYSDAIDPLKRGIFRMPVRIHVGEIDGEWRAKEKAVDKLLRRAVRQPTWVDRIWVRWLGVLIEAWVQTKARYVLYRSYVLRAYWFCSHHVRAAVVPRYYTVKGYGVFCRDFVFRVSRVCRGDRR